MLSLTSSSSFFFSPPIDAWELSSIYNHLIKRATKVSNQMLSPLESNFFPFFFRQTCRARKNLISSGDMRSIYCMHEKRALDSYFHGWEMHRISFDYKTYSLESSSRLYIQPILLAFLFCIARISYVWALSIHMQIRVCDISKSFEIVQPFSCLEGLCHQYENLNFATSRWALKIFGTIGDT